MESRGDKVDNRVLVSILQFSTHFIKQIYNWNQIDSHKCRPALSKVYQNFVKLITVSFPSPLKK